MGIIINSIVKLSENTSALARSDISSIGSVIFLSNKINITVNNAETRSSGYTLIL